MKYIYPQNLRAAANMWLWFLRDFIIIAVSALIAVILLVKLRSMLPAAIVLSYAFMTIRMDDTTVFASLRRYLEADFMSENNLIILETADGVHKFKVLTPLLEIHRTECRYCKQQRADLAK